MTEIRRCKLRTFSNVDREAMVFVSRYLEDRKYGLDLETVWFTSLVTY